MTIDTLTHEEAVCMIVEAEELDLEQIVGYKAQPLIDGGWIITLWFGDGTHKEWTITRRDQLLH